MPPKPYVPHDGEAKSEQDERMFHTDVQRKLISLLSWRRHTRGTPCSAQSVGCPVWPGKHLLKSDFKTLHTPQRSTMWPSLPFFFNSHIFMEYMCVKVSFTCAFQTHHFIPADFLDSVSGSFPLFTSRIIFVACLSSLFALAAWRTCLRPNSHVSHRSRGEFPQLQGGGKDW